MRPRLPIRPKLVALLCLITLVPLALVAWLDYRRIAALGRDLADSHRAALVAKARAELDSLARNYAVTFSVRNQLLEALIRRQAREVELRLAGPPPTAAPSVRFAREFDEHPGSIEGLTRPEKYARSDGAGGRVAVPVSYERQVFRLAPGVSPGQVLDDIARLADLTGFYRELHARHGDLVYWQFTSLENGLHASYPGHGGYPASFDPRARPWYRDQRRVRRLALSEPVVDAVTRRVVVSVTMPVHRPDGAFAGVTAIDVPVTSVLSRYPLPETWGEGARLFVVATPGGPADRGEDISIIAKQTYSETGGNWQASIGRERLALDDPTARAELTGAMRAGRDGVLEAGHAGREALWAYRRLVGGGMYLLLVVPQDAITAAADVAYAYALAATNAQVAQTVPLGIGVVVVVVAIAWVTARAVTGPVEALAAAAGRIARGDLKTRVSLATGDEFEDLGCAFNEMVPKLEERVHIMESLHLAREVQQNLLPSSPPQVAGLDVFGVTVYCDETGGDYYDFLDLRQFEPARLGIAIGDVSGHGIPSALLMTTVRALLRTFADQGRGPAEIMGRINEYLSRDVHGGRFMTLFYASVDTSRMRVRWANAGHAPALVYRRTGDRFTALCGEDIPLGVETGWRYGERTASDWREGDVCVLGTDGIWEARDRAGEPFGEARLRAVVREASARPAREICEAILEAVRAFRGPQPQSDDITVVVARMTAAAGAIPGR